MEIHFLEKVMSNMDRLSDKIILRDDTNTKGATFGQIGEISGKVYAYLQEKGIGTEDFVLICLPRGIQPIIASVGVWRNGSAFVVVEDNYAPERIEFIKKDCNCKLTIDSEVWQEIQTYTPNTGYTKADPHDAAFAVYTSGTTGNPKGVLHEYGNLNRMMESIIMQSCEPLATPDDRFALVAPLNFIASELIILYGLYFGVLLYVVPYYITKNPLYVGMFLIKNKITGMFLTPSYIRKMTSKPPSLKFCIIGSEPANEVYLEDLKIHNFYLMSESGFAVSHFLIDKKYEFTPIGKSEFGHNILLLGEDGEPVPEGEAGEICFENQYVRGYINLPEETKKAFRNGYYHSGDLACRLPDGNMVICGRLNDMVKINGNRVEPGEIEHIAKKVLHVDWCAARIFDDGNRVFICVYYTDKLEKPDFEKTRKEMEKYLPYYMLPSYFIHIDEVPLRPNGKMDRKALPAPDLNDFRSEYVAPTTDTEKALCAAFEKVLKIPNISVTDDFYQLGGDSMSSMEILVESKLPGLSGTDIFRGHTPRKIAEIYEENYMGDDGIPIHEKNEAALKIPHLLTTEQIYMVDYQLYTPKSTMYNLYNLVKLDKNLIQLDLLAKAFHEATLAHPALLTTFFFGEDGELLQKYTPEVFPESIPVEKITEAEFEQIKDTLVQPFKIVNSCLFRVRIFETEEAGYLFFDVHHTLFDGTSGKVFFGDIFKAYAGNVLEKDYYYYILPKRQEMIRSDFYDKSREYFEHKYGNKQWFTRPFTDHEPRENKNNEIFLPLSVTPAELEQLEAKYGLTKNGFFIACALISTAFYNRKRNIMLSWIYNGRNDMAEMTAVGLLFRNLPVALFFTKNLTLKDLYQEVISQINQGIEHSCYPYVELGANCVTGDLECVLYQDDLRSLGDLPGILGEMDVQNDSLASQNALDLEILNTPDGMHLMMDYAASRYDEASMERYGRIFTETVSLLLSNMDKDTVNMRKLFRSLGRKTKEFGFLNGEWLLEWL